MHHFQRSLPRLPIPKLEDSCERYLSAQKPLLSAEDHSCHKQLVDSFAKGVGLGECTSNIVWYLFNTRIAHQIYV